LRNVHGVKIVYGGTFPATIWRTIMAAAHDGVPVRDFALPPAAAAPVGPVAPVSPTPAPPTAGPLPPPPHPTLPPRCHGKHCKP
jgi:hypothetical protein